MKPFLIRLLSKFCFCRELLCRAGARVIECLSYTPSPYAVDSLPFIGISEFGKKSLQTSLFVTISFFLSCISGYSFNKISPDLIIMRDGTQYQGFIIKKDAKEVILQQETQERTIPKAAIQRIDDAHKSMLYFADLVDGDKAPPWRMMVQDLRNNDAIKSFVQIPPTTISDGYLRNVPYLSFRANKHGEMNIYGDPKDPACVELGAYLRGDQLKEFQIIARQFFAGYIASRSGIATLYHLNLNGDEKPFSRFIFKITPPSDPEARGGWWISIYDPVRLAKARLSDQEYQKLTLPSTQVRSQDGTLLQGLEAQHKIFLNTSMMQWLGRLPGFHGFYRNKENELKVVPNVRS